VSPFSAFVKRSSLAKITRPTYARVLPRARLFRLLDAPAHSLVWVSAPPGAGKTAFLSSYLQARRVGHVWYQLDAADGDLPTFFHYLGVAAERAGSQDPLSLPHLTAEYAGGVSVFARRYFEAFAARFTTPFILVLDNYHEVPLEAQLHAVLRDGIEALPAGFITVVLSRTDPPAEMARLRMNDRLLLLGWDEVRLTLDEVEGIQKLICGDRPVSSGEDFYQRTQGWAGGLVLLLQHAAAGGGSSQSPPGATHRVLFDYFAGEVFATLAPSVQRVLVIAALLNKIAVRHVIELTNVTAAAEVLQELNRKNYFTLKHDHAEEIYEFHPLFSEFLSARAEQILTPAELNRLRERAAELLELDGQAEDAAELLRASGASAALAALARRQARSLIDQGRYKVLESWLTSVPDECFTEDPWLLYWLGQCRLPTQPAEARDCLQRAHASFRACGDITGQVRTWCAIVDNLVFGWSDLALLDRWIEQMDELLRTDPRLPEIEPELACGMFLALMYRKPERADLPDWEERVRQIVLYSGHPQLRLRVGTHLLSYYTWWKADLAKAESLVSTLKPQMQAADASALTRITWHAMAAGYFSLSGQERDSLACVDEGLQISEQSGVHAWDTLLSAQGIFTSVCYSEPHRIEGYLQRMQVRLKDGTLMDKSFYYYASAWYRTTQGDLQGACEMTRIAVAMAERAGARFPAASMRNGLGTILLRMGERTAGLALIRESHAEGLLLRSPTIEYLTFFAEAALALEEGDEEICLQHLRRGLTAAAHRFYDYPWWADVMAQLYARALAHGIEPEYVSTVIRKRNLTAPLDEGLREHWPWPIKIRTLGGFEIFKEGQPLRFTGKSPRKPLEVLKALIALGGTDVNQESLIDALWPELEGDKAHAAFETALYRLRKLLADEAALSMKSGRLSLNADRVWVDSISVEALLKKIAAAAAHPTDARGTLLERHVAATATANRAKPQGTLLERHVAAAATADRAKPRGTLLERHAAFLRSAASSAFLPGESASWATAYRDSLCSRLRSALQELAPPLSERRSNPAQRSPLSGPSR
jgi:LuxR family transcriptional regulator, maltose regulon positive regulatory protein